MTPEYLERELLKELGINPAMVEASKLDVFSQLCDDIKTLQSTIKCLAYPGGRSIEKYMLGAHKSILIKMLKKQKEYDPNSKEPEKLAGRDDLQQPEEDDEFDRLIIDKKVPFWELELQRESHITEKLLAEAMEEHEIENSPTPAARAVSLAASSSDSAIIDVKREYGPFQAYKIVNGFCDTEALMIDAMEEDGGANIKNETFGQDRPEFYGNLMCYDLD